MLAVHRGPQQGPAPRCRVVPTSSWHSPATSTLRRSEIWSPASTAQCRCPTSAKTVPRAFQNGDVVCKALCDTFQQYSAVPPLRTCLPRPPHFVYVPAPAAGIPAEAHLALVWPLHVGELLPSRFSGAVSRWPPVPPLWIGNNDAVVSVPPRAPATLLRVQLSAMKPQACSQRQRASLLCASGHPPKHRERTWLFSIPLPTRQIASPIPVLWKA
mmetsp:Transcript_2461/g.5627  ORF Transcript_2461/g.5627 Transcript_2461/m.5627 type:complete len:214 (+) Transcript_2461:212-853(+)